VPPRREPAQRAADARTLYLAAAEPLRVTSTGEALVVSRPAQAHLGVQRVPVARVLRVICTVQVDWSGAALALCMQRGITVSWLDAHGASRGHLWPARPRQVDLADGVRG
jgi:CRISPR/Cas system-associated endonuclease Cas1